MLPAPMYSSKGQRVYNLSYRKPNGNLRTNYTYKVPRPYTPRSLPNITSSLPTRFNGSKEYKYFHSHEDLAGVGEVNKGGAVLIKDAGYFWPLLRRVVSGGPSGVIHYIDSGSGPNQRLGNKITLKRLWIKGNIRCGTHSDVYNGGRMRFRVCIVQDTQVNGVQLLTVDTLKLFYSTAIDSPRHPVYSGKFKVLYDKTFCSNQVLGFDEGEAAGKARYLFQNKDLPFEFKTPLNIQVIYQGSTGAITEIVNNNLYFFICTDVNPGDGGAPGEGRCTPNLFYESMVYYDDQ